MDRKEYHRRYKKKWRKLNKKKIRLDGIKYREENKEKMKIYQKIYQEKNKKKISIHVKIYQEKNKKKILKKQIIYREKNKDKIREGQRIHYQKNKNRIMEKHKLYRKKRRENDKNYRIMLRLRTLLFQAITKYTKEGKKSTSKKYGIDYKIIIEYLKPFPKDLSKYHIDHIKPLCSFDLNDPEEIKKAFAPENHQWLLAKENQMKAGKY